MKFFRLFLFLGLTLVTRVGFADTGVASLNQLLQNFQSMQADFTQIISDSKGGLNSQQTGSVIIQKPNQFRWEVSGPNEQLFISDGKNLWNIEPDLDQATKSPLTQNLSTTPLLLLSGSVQDINNVFTVSKISAGEYRLIPTGGDSLIKEVDLTFAQNVISRISVLNTMGQTAVVEFSNVQFNVSVPANTFTYIPAKTVQVLEQGNSSY